MTNPVNWNHCRSEDNPLDSLTRVVSAFSFKENNLWWHGPQWLEEKKDLWPKISIGNKKYFERQVEVEQRSCQIASLVNVCPPIIEVQ